MMKKRKEKQGKKDGRKEKECRTERSKKKKKESEADDDNESGQSIEQGERRKRRKIASKYERDDKKESEMVARRDYLTIPPREVLIRNVGDYLHGMRSTPLPPISPSLFSRFYPLSFPPLIRFFLLVSFLYFVSLFLSFCFNPRFFLFPFFFFF